MASNSGTINVTGGGNVISTTTGTAVNITNTTIGGSGVTFQSVSSNGASSGIILNNTGSGGFTITGDGTNAQNGSGGTIANSTSHGILLTNTNGFSASSLDLDSPGDTLAEHGLLATDIGGTNLFRGGRVTGIGHDSGDGIRIANTNTNLTLFEINNTLFNGTTTGGNDGVIVESLGSSVMRVDILNGSEFDSLRGDGVQANSAGTSNLTINLKNSNFNTDNGGADGGLAGGTSRITFISADSSTLTTVVEDNVIDDTGTQFGQLPVSSSIGVLDYIANDSSSLIARVRRNDISGVDQEQAIRVVGDDNAAALDVIIDDNDIDNIENENAIFVYIRDSTQLANISIINNDIGTGPDGAVGGGDDQPIAEHGIELRVQSRNIPPNANDAITANVLISGNDIVNSDSGSETIDLESEVDNPDGTSSDPGATLNATVTGNNLQNLGGGDELEADSEDGVQTGNLHGRSLLCLNMSGNTLDAGAGTMVVDEDGGTAQDAILNIVQTSQANLASANGIPTGNVTVAGTPNFSAAACATPTHGSPLTAAGGQGPGAAASLTTAQLSVIVDEASSRFSATGLSAAQTQLLQSVSVAIVDLADGRLGEAFGMTISIDVDAAGYGWFVDATPDDDSEFDADGQAITEEAAQGMDLLTVVMHELGHILGLDHAADGLMAEALTLGTRSADAHDEVFSDQTW